MKTLLIIDGHAIIHRAFHALPPMNSANGTPTNAVYGFFAMIHKAVNDFKPTHLAICFDTPVRTFRKELLDEYQASRPEPPDELKSQFKLIKYLLEADSITCLEKGGFEADDVIGTLVAKYKNEAEILILTGDKDILQLVQPHVGVIVPKIGLSNVIVYDREKVIEKMGVPPEQIPDIKALAGDPSDNYAGIKGLGPKTAIKILQQFLSVEHLYEHIEEMKEEKLKNTLLENKEKVLLLKTIATIRHDVDIKTELEDMKIIPYSENLKKAFEEYQMNSLIKRYFPGSPLVKKETPKPEVLEETSEKKDTSQMDLF